MLTQCGLNCYNDLGWMRDGLILPLPSASVDTQHSTSRSIVCSNPSAEVPTSNVDVLQPGAGACSRHRSLGGDSYLLQREEKVTLIGRTGFV